MLADRDPVHLERPDRVERSFCRQLLRTLAVALAQLFAVAMDVESHGLEHPVCGTEARPAKVAGRTVCSRDELVPIDITRGYDRQDDADNCAIVASGVGGGLATVRRYLYRAFGGPLVPRPAHAFWATVLGTALLSGVSGTRVGWCVVLESDLCLYVQEGL